MIKQTYGPMLFHPEPLASSDEVSSKPKESVDPCLLGDGSVVGIMLHIQSNERLRNAINHRHEKRSRLCDPQVLQVEEECAVANGTEQKSPCGELFSTSDNLEHFFLNLALKLGIELVAKNAVYDEAVRDNSLGSTIIYKR
jgi:hypothetical protein